MLGCQDYMDWGVREREKILGRTCGIQGSGGGRTVVNRAAVGSWGESGLSGVLSLPLAKQDHRVSRKC